MRKVILASLLTLALAGYAAAVPTVTITGVHDATNWYVYATDSVGDNYGICFLSFRVGGIDVDSAGGAGGNNDPGDLSPHFASFGGAGNTALKGTYGFNNNTIVVDAVNSNQVDYSVIGINPATPTWAVWGIGQGTVNVSYRPYGQTSNTTGSISNPFLVATGTLLAGQTPFFVPGYINLAAPLPFMAQGGGSQSVSVDIAAANIYTVGSGSTASAKVGLAYLVGAPEPATLALLGIGGVMALIRRRRAQ
jgi:hypothetical protein